MKKSLLICILAVLMCACVLFAACSPSLEADTLNSMKELLYQTYKDSNPATTYKVVGLVASNGQKANIKWDVKVTEGPANDVKVGEIADGEQTIEVNPYPTTDVKYTLTATITNEKGKAYQIDGAPVSISFERSLAKFVVNTYDEYLTACKATKEGDELYNAKICIKAYVIGVVNYESSSKGSLYLQDADGHGYYAYNPTDASKDCSSTADLRAKWPIGTEVYVKGTVTTYSGQYEFNKECEIILTGNTAESAGVTLDYVDATADFAAAKSNEDTTLGKYQNRRVTLKGAVINRITIEYNDDGSFKRVYYYFTLPDSTTEFNVYYTIYFIDGATMQDLHSKLAVGNQVDLTGVVSVYSKDFQLYPDSATSVSNIVSLADTDAKKVEFAKNNVTLVDTASEGDVIDLPKTGVLDTTITWAFADGETYDGIAKIEDSKLTILEASTEPVTLDIVATISSGSESTTKNFTVKIPALRTSFIKAALTAGATLEDTKTTEDSYMIIGTISKITTAYNEKFKNVSFNVVDAEGNELLIFCYNLDDAATLKEGDFVAFAAPIKKWGTDIEAVSTFVKLEVTTLKAAYDAGTEGKTDSVNVYGYVKSIDNAYSSDYDSISITITDGTNDLYCYRVKGGKDITVGDYLYITAKTGSYNSKGQLAAGGTYVKSAIYVAPSTGEGEGGGSEGIPSTNGSVESPVTVADAITACNKLASGAYSGGIWYVKGYIVGVPSYRSAYSNYSLNIADELGGTTTIKVYGLKLNDKSTGVYEGDLIVISGYLQNYNGNTAEITFNNNATGTQKDCLLETYTAGTSTIDVSAESSANATVTVADGKTSGTNGTNFTFTVNVADGYELVNVKVNGEIVTANTESVYTGTVAGKTTIVVTTKEEGVTEATNYSHTFASGGLKTGSNTLSDVAWNVTMEGSTYIGWDSNSGRGIQFGTSKGAATSVTISTEGIKNFKTIKLNLSMASNGTGKVIVKVGGVQVGNEISLTTAATDYTFTLDAESSAKIEIIFTNTAKAMYIGSIEVTA